MRASRDFIFAITFSLAALTATVAASFSSDSECPISEVKEACRRQDVEVSPDGVTIYWNLNNLEQDDPELIKALRDLILVPPDKKPLNLTRYRSYKNLQVGQWLWLSW